MERLERPQRRSKVEIKIDILKSIIDGRKAPTRIMGIANLSYKALTEYLVELMNSGLIKEYDNENSRVGRVFYGITEKGAETVNKFNQAASELREASS